MVEQKLRHIFGAKFSICRSRELPGRFPGIPGAPELRKEFGTTLVRDQEDIMMDEFSSMIEDGNPLTK